MKPIDLLLSKLHGVKSQGSQGKSHRAYCPVHEAAGTGKPSLIIDEAPDGKPLVSCKGPGCSYKSIIAAVGLRHADLVASNHAQPTPKATTMNRPGHGSIDLAAEFVRDLRNVKEACGANVRETRRDYYGDEFAILRFDGDSGKCYRPVHKNGNGWKLGDPEGPLPLFHGDRIGKASRVFVFEGEKCVEAAETIDLPAITTSHGAQSAHKSDWSRVKGKHIVIVPDAGTAGEAYLNAAAKCCREAGAASIRVVRLPGLADGEDIVQWLEARDSADAETLRAEIEAMADAAPEMDGDNADGDGDLIARCAADVNTRPLEWYWRGKFVAGAINLLIGMPDVGKSVLTCDFTARTTTGEAWPPIDGERHDNTIGSVIIMAAEDSPETILVPRLLAAGADLRKVHFVEGIKRDTQAGKVRDQFDIARDVSHLRQMHRRIPDLRLVIIDPLDSYINAKTDTNVGNQARAALHPLKDWAEETGITVLIVHHFNKSVTTNAMDKVSGARSFGALPRSVWAVGRDPNDDKRTILAPIKLNLIRQEEKKAIAYRLETSVNDPNQPCVHWCAEVVSITACDIVAGKQTQRSKAAEWLREMLTDGPMLSSDLQQHAESAGHVWRTIQRAKDEAGVIVEQQRDGARIGGWSWRIK